MSASTINTSSVAKIFTTNTVNKIEVINENIIQSDSESREVIKKGYLLSQINLTTIPDIIQNAINEAMLDTKEQTLADALIETLRLSISNLDDGVYKKTYIDNTISYIENLVTSKVSPETAASIADSKLALALEGFATTSSVKTLSSRVGNSEIEISNVKQTINTKDNARALQIEQMEARVNDTFANYSDAIDLYVDAEGNVKSEKIEKLEANNSVASVSINEQNKISLDAQGNYVAFVAKFIADSNGKIVGYNFSDTNDLASFTINADVFKISNSDNSYTPFTIDGNNILFNGKMTFANVTGTDGIVTTSNVQTVFNSEVTTIDGGKITTNSIGAEKINTVGLIAENISADEIVGKTLVGSVINGASINGAVIKASYLDLDGELEVLTNYHITPAMYAVNPSLYTDAVYLSGSNEYRIPSISTVRESTISNTTSGTATYYGVISSYNTGNIGNNLKAVKIRPTWNNQVAFQLINSVCSDTWFNNMFYGVHNHFKLSLGDTKLLECKVELLSGADWGRGEDDTTTVTITGQGFNPIGIGTMSASYSNDVNNTYSLNIGIGILTVNVVISGGSSTDGEGTGTSAPNTISINGTLETGTNTIPFDWISGKLKFEQIVAPSKSYANDPNSKTTFSLNQSLYINNMI